MHQRDRARKVFEDAGTLRTKDGKLQRLIKEVDGRPAMCWPELVDEMRTRYPEYKVQLAEMLFWSVDDKSIRVNIIRHSDPRFADEHASLERAIEKLDAVADATELQAIVDLGDKHLMERVRKKPGIPNGLAHVIEHRLRPQDAPKGEQPDEREPPKPKPTRRAGRNTEP